tara:strand:- start:1347 stop:1487 length:141 start_codon:yes stop_codon:yes gene_type:complete
LELKNYRYFLSYYYWTWATFKNIKKIEKTYEQTTGEMGERLKPAVC